MNEISASRAESRSASAAPVATPRSGQFLKLRVWDVPTRLFHWLVAGCVAGAWLTAETERFRQIHVTLGYSVILLVVFRLLWGFIGTEHARFSDFVVGPRRIMAHVSSLLSHQATHSVGHNPLGAIAIVLMLALLLGSALSGWANHLELGGHWLEELHEGLATGLLGVIGIHVAGVVIESLIERQNLAGAMITGRKRVPADARPVPPRIAVAVLLVAVLGGLWGWQWIDSRGFSLPGLQTAAQSGLKVRHEH